MIFLFGSCCRPVDKREKRTVSEQYRYLRADTTRVTHNGAAGSSVNHRCTQMPVLLPVHIFRQRLAAPRIVAIPCRDVRLDHFFLMFCQFANPSELKRSDVYVYFETKWLQWKRGFFGCFVFKGASTRKKKLHPSAHIGAEPTSPSNPEFTLTFLTL